MKKKGTAELGRALAAAALLALVAAPALAQVKIGFVNTARVLVESAEGKARIEAWQAFVNSKKQEIEAAEKELQGLQEEFAEQQLDSEAQTRMQRSIEERATAVQRMSQDASSEAQRRRDQIVQEIGGRLRALLEEYGRSNGYSAIFVRNPEQQIFVDDALDVTGEVLELYDDRHPAPATGSG